MRDAPMHLLVEGWRGINHSYALVNQFQLLALAERTDVQVLHIDKPCFLPQWNAQANGPGFHAAHSERLAAFAAPAPGAMADWAYRIYSPLELSASPQARRVACFIVTEMGLDAESFAPGYDLAAFHARGDIVITPSHWSRQRLLEFGLQPEGVHVVPHGASPDYFFPMPEALRQSQRQALGFAPEDVVLLNIGAAIWNKGVDVLLQAFAHARQANPRLKLVFKDQRSMYGLSGDDFVQKTLAGHALLTPELLGAIQLIPSNLSMPQMNAIYGLADCYVSPYRAEGFNLPALEAMACGLPVLVTHGGATDDFVPQAHGHRHIPATLHRDSVVQGKRLAAYLEPDFAALVDQLAATGTRAPDQLASPADWQAPVEHLLQCLRAA